MFKLLPPADMMLYVIILTLTGDLRDDNPINDDIAMERIEPCMTEIGLEDFPFSQQILLHLLTQLLHDHQL
jgi:hypothetical protein